MSFHSKIFAILSQKVFVVEDRERTQNRLHHTRFSHAISAFMGKSHSRTRSNLAAVGRPTSASKNKLALHELYKLN